MWLCMHCVHHIILWPPKRVHRQYTRETEVTSPSTPLYSTITTQTDKLRENIHHSQMLTGPGPINMTMYI
jgi:hypothetical protein